MSEDRVREKIAEQEHDQWIYWAKSLLPELEKLVSIHRECTCSTCRRVVRWRMLFIPYSELTEEQKNQDRVWADKTLALPEMVVLAEADEDGLLSPEELAKIKDKQFIDGRWHYMNPYELIRKQQALTAAAKDEEWTERMEKHSKSLMEWVEEECKAECRAECQAKLEQVFAALERCTKPTDGYQEDGSVAWTKGDIILSRGWWQALKEKGLKGVK